MITKECGEYFSKSGSQKLKVQYSSLVFESPCKKATSIAVIHSSFSMQQETKFRQPTAKFKLALRSEESVFNAGVLLKRSFVKICRKWQRN